MRVAVYTDYVYHREGDAVYAERAFALFLARLGQELDRLVVVGRLDPRRGRAHYRLPDELEFVALAHYESLARPGAVAGALARSARRFWAVLGGVDTVWLLGPHPMALAFAALARLRRRRIVLGVRQDLPVYVRNRHPGRRWIHLAGTRSSAPGWPLRVAMRRSSWDRSWPAATRVLGEFSSCPCR